MSGLSRAYIGYISGFIRGSEGLACRAALQQ